MEFSISKSKRLLAAVTACVYAVAGAGMNYTAHASTVEYEEKIAMEYPFSDLNPASYIGEAAYDLYQRKIMGGYPDGTAQVNNNVVRAEAAKYLSLAGELPSVSYNGQFSDVVGDEWFAPYIASAAHANIVKGYPDGKARPARYISRDEFGTMLERLNPNVSFPLHGYTDVPHDVWFERGARAAAYYGIFSEDNTYDPTKLVTREEVIIGLYHMNKINNGDIPYFELSPVVPNQTQTYTNTTNQTTQTVTENNETEQETNNTNESQTQNTQTTTNTTTSETTNTSNTNTTVNTNNNSTTITTTQVEGEVVLNLLGAGYETEIEMDEFADVYNFHIDNEMSHGIEFEEIEFSIDTNIPYNELLCNLGFQNGIVFDTEIPNAQYKLHFTNIYVEIDPQFSEAFEIQCMVDLDNGGEEFGFIFEEIQIQNIVTSDMVTQMAGTLEINYETSVPHQVDVLPAVEVVTGNIEVYKENEYRTVFTGDINANIFTFSVTNKSNVEAEIQYIDVRVDENFVDDIYNFMFCSLYEHNGPQVSDMEDPNSQGTYTFTSLQESISPNEKIIFNMICNVANQPTTSFVPIHFPELEVTDMNGNLMDVINVNPDQHAVESAVMVENAPSI